MLEHQLALHYIGCRTHVMNITELTPQQLRRAASIKEKLDALYRELRACSMDRHPMSGIGEEAHHERGGEKENCGCAEGEMGEGQAGITGITYCVAACA